MSSFAESRRLQLHRNEGKPRNSESKLQYLSWFVEFEAVSLPGVLSYLENKKKRSKFQMFVKPDSGRV